MTAHSERQTGGPQLMQAMNRAKVLNGIRANPNITRQQLVGETGLAVSSITNIVNCLMELKLVKERVPETTGMVGRRAVPLALNGDVNRLVCATVRKGAVNVALVGIQGTVFEEEVFPFLDAVPQAEAIASLLSDYLLGAARHDGRILAVAVALPGMALEEGRRAQSVELRWRDADLLTPLQGALPVPVFVINISIAKAIAVARSLSEAGEKARNIALLDLDGGVGLVQIMDGRVQDGVLGEIGHTTVDAGGERCFCGNVGCLEGMCSPERALTMAREGMVVGRCGDLRAHLAGREPEFADLLLAERHGDEDVRALLKECGVYLGIAMTSAVHLLSPAALYLCDGELPLSKAAWESAHAWLKSHAYPQLVAALTCRSVKTDGRGVHTGLLEYALDRLFDDRSENFVALGG